MAGIVQGQDPGSQYLVCEDYLPRFSPCWFSDAFWGASIEPVTSGGRGSAWFISDNDRSWVLRHYLRGGAVSRLNADRFLFVGTSRVRSFNELRLLEDLAREGLPVPEPIAASCIQVGLFYRASILIKRIPGVTTMGERFFDLTASELEKIGSVVRRFHDLGVYHSDLNCFNILINDESVYLIDFDKCRRYESSPQNAIWKTKNLDRLKRSIDKICLPASSEDLPARWQSLLEGYRAD
ncbi:3-deoxy-D-manno-octulosonic acid kinase [Marinobacter sp. 1-3A]|uniref:3-deoxy-D-manno-octulosonic acid kinase n=1 Tax=Marinobacter sp. 1-3A TaxID=2582920 RepID=UPI001904BEC2|nr:3-deoxy-D-manno-octulosonic acid kinase [Marinobacter sp. 1-3A]MBK1874757.1 3-deoxy-D-manno-octulosonic acid kinase [Marinobacter sp. 1-3A]